MLPRSGKSIVTVRDVLGYVLMPLVLYLIGRYSFWYRGEVGFDSIRELANLLAVSLLIVGGTCLLFQLPAGHLPLRGVLLVAGASIFVASVTLIFRGLGLEVEENGARVGAQAEFPFVATVRIFIEFTVLLVCCFGAPRMGNKIPLPPQLTTDQ